MTGFEPATSCSQSKRSTELNYIPGWCQRPCRDHALVTCTILPPGFRGLVLWPRRHCVFSDPGSNGSLPCEGRQRRPAFYLKPCTERSAAGVAPAPGTPTDVRVCSSRVRFPVLAAHQRRTQVANLRSSRPSAERPRREGRIRTGVLSLPKRARGQAAPLPDVRFDWPLREAPEDKPAETPLVERVGFEPTTRRVRGGCSTGLSYIPRMT
jgi:hypothetical protein